ncbi:MAG: MarR family transcriptional regulator [Actinobacteria bacterium]|nr:MarR family transcriptional regulator [Actinomycetota bacterium]
MQELASGTVVDAVLQGSRALVAIAARSLAEVTDEVTLPQYRAIVVLCAHGPIAMRELADELTCSASTATRLCDRLVSKGLVDRGPREANRREVEVRATARGIELVRAVTARRRAEIRRIVDTMPAEQRPALVDALQAFAAAAGEAPDQAWAIGWDL